MIWLQPQHEAFGAVADTLARAIGGKLDGIEQGTIAAVVRGDRLLGAFAITHWQPQYASAELIAAGAKGWVSRNALRDLFDYLFRQLECRSVMMRADAANEAACNVLRRHGLEEVQIPHARGYGRPEAVFVLTQDKASRFLGE